ncbi:MAG: hypothetical protein C4323_01425 [Mastigocladus sp. ERB_26_2]
MQFLLSSHNRILKLNHPLLLPEWLGKGGIFYTILDWKLEGKGDTEDKGDDLEDKGEVEKN